MLESERKIIYNDKLEEVKLTEDVRINDDIKIVNQIIPNDLYEHLSDGQNIIINDVFDDEKFYEIELSDVNKTKVTTFRETVRTNISFQFSVKKELTDSEIKGVLRRINIKQLLDE